MMAFDFKTIIKGIFIAFCIFVVILLLVEVADRALFRPKSIFGRTVREFEKEKSEVQILFVGQSDMKRAVIPDIMSFKAYNFAELGESFIETYFKLKYYIDDMPRLKVIVLPLTLASFSSFRTNRIGTKYYSYGYISYRDLWELYQIKGPLVIGQKLMSLSPLLDREGLTTFWKNVRRLIKGQPIERAILQEGYHLLTMKGIVNENSARRRIQLHFQGQDIFDKDLFLYFEKILTLCQKRGIKVVTLTTPVTDDYIKHAEKFITKSALYEKVFMNQKFHPYIFKHLDYLDFHAKDHTLFVDADHLSHEGAMLFSKQVAPELSRVMEEIKKGSLTGRCPVPPIAG
ncbi:MAG: hypothetical protein HXY44_03315 [Syntrophaceae bacterium]|nr:hypothetical protein [Syntrophaceae bacterium]